MNSCRFATQASIAALALGLAACGGGGGGVGSTPGPGPGPGPTPTPATPTPSPTPPDMSVKLSADTTFQTVGIESYGSIEEGYAWGDGTEVRYLVSSNSIRLELSDGRTLDFPNTQPVGYAFAENMLTSLDEGSAELKTFWTFPVEVDGVELSYMRVGAFVLNPLKDGTLGVSTFMFGYETKVMPAAGSATYSTSVTGGGWSEDTFYQFGSDSNATLTANFGTNTVSTTLHLIGAPEGGGATADFGSFTGSGIISQAAFEGAFAGTSGNFWGSFFGPQASEMGYAFLVGSGTLFAQGQVVGRKD